VRERAGLAGPASALAATDDSDDIASGSPAESLAALIERHVAFLVDYQDAAYAMRYRALVAKAEQREREVAGDAGGLPLTHAVARAWFKLLAYKDEYEVARLYADPAFRRRLDDVFDGDWSLRLHLSPPLISRVDPRTGRPKKISVGPWALRAMRLLRHGKRLRGTRFDPFGYLEERRVERALIDDFERLLEVELLPELTTERVALAVELASLPESIRGFGPVKARAIAEVDERRRALLVRWRNTAPAMAVAA
jgi:indolepyruvate ferredoxin oxidoreductase